MNESKISCVYAVGVMVCCEQFDNVKFRVKSEFLLACTVCSYLEVLTSFDTSVAAVVELAGTSSLLRREYTS